MYRDLGLGGQFMIEEPQVELPAGTSISLTLIPPSSTVPPSPPPPLNPLQKFMIENGIAAARNLLRNQDCLRFVSNTIQEAARMQGKTVPADGIDPNTGAIVYSAVFDALARFLNQMTNGNIIASNVSGANNGGTTYMTTDPNTGKVTVNNEYYNLSLVQQGQHTLHEAIHQLGLDDNYMASAIGVYRPPSPGQSPEDIMRQSSRHFNERFQQVCR